jgi:hypothetical protein
MSAAASMPPPERIATRYRDDGATDVLLDGALVARVTVRHGEWRCENRAAGHTAPVGSRSHGIARGQRIARLLAAGTAAPNTTITRGQT